jgi:hypothetical protein
LDHYDGDWQYEMMTPDTRSRLQWTSLALIVAGIALLLFWLDPVQSGIFPPCPFRFLTGLKCPGCGTLRGLHQLLHGNPMASWRLNPLMVIMLPFLGYALISYTWRVFRGKPLSNITLPAFWTWLLLAVILVYWVVRNVY